MQVPDYNSSLRSESATTISQNKDDIGLLVACKIQLSSEVIRWKTESLRLQKECDSAKNHSKELDQTVSKLVEQMKDLESRLVHAKEENKSLRMKTSESVQEVPNCIQRLSQSLNKYHSFPTVGLNRSLKSKFSGQLDPQLSQDWREVSQKLMKQMQDEMKELQQMNSCLDTKHSENASEDMNLDVNSKETLDGCLYDLVSDTKSLKLELLEQRKKLQSLLRTISYENFIKKDLDSVSMRKENSQSLSAGIITSTPSIQGSSNKTFCDNLVDQLRGLRELHKEQERDAWNMEDDLTLHPTYAPVDIPQNFKEEKKLDEAAEDRICPICHKIFGTAVPQREFEDHVCNHLETESESLLENYVVL